MEIQIFHGSNEIVEYPEIRKTKYTKDFEQAIRWASHQISFHTLQALDCITFLRSETVYDGKTEK